MNRSVLLSALTRSALTRSIKKSSAAAVLIALPLGLPLGGVAMAHHPDKENQPVHQRIDVIGPLGNNLPPGHRRVYNRPSYWGGKLMYHIAPSSQEAMAWHRAVHSDAYKDPKRCLRLEQHYFYPKPWEAMRIGPRVSAVNPPQESRMDSADMLEELQMQSMPSTEPLNDGDLSAPVPKSEPGLPSPSDLDPGVLEPKVLNPESLEPSELDLPALDAEGGDSPSDVKLPNAEDLPTAPVLEAPQFNPSGPAPDAADVEVDAQSGAFVFRRGGIVRAMGLEQEAPEPVSREQVSQHEKTLEVAKRPTYFRKLFPWGK